MKANNIILAAAIFVATTMTFVAFSKDTSAASNSSGRYQGVSATYEAIYVVDTTSGHVRTCYRGFTGKTAQVVGGPKCSPWSD